MKMCHSIALCVLAVLVSHVKCESNSIPTSMNQVAEQKELTVCLDDSDCNGLGEGNQQQKCFEYLCYPWKDDSKLPLQLMRRTCRKDEECESGDECIFHPSRRTVFRGVCFKKVESCFEGDASKCPKDYGCCGMSCCEKKFSSQFASLPCSAHLMCQDLNLGQFCCPQKNSTTSVCCDTDPNPPPLKQSPSIGDKAAAASIASSLVATLAAAIVALVVRA